MINVMLKKRKERKEKKEKKKKKKINVQFNFFKMKRALLPLLPRSSGGHGSKHIQNLLVKIKKNLLLLEWFPHQLL
jgi:hypothetical protein